MDNILQISGSFIENNTDFPALIQCLKDGFSSNKIIVPQRHHHDFPNPDAEIKSTMLLMPAWNPGESAGVKIIAVSPENGKYDLPAIQGTYIYLDTRKGKIKAIIEAKSLTAKRTAATSALASIFLSRKDASSLLMIGTGRLSVNLILAHASVRDIKNVFVWGRNYSKALKIVDELQNENFTIKAIQNIDDKISEVDIISCATLSNTPLVLGNNISPGQHIDLVGAYRKDMREADDDLIIKSSIYIDTPQGIFESGDLYTPIQNEIIQTSDIKADLFELCSGQKSGRKDAEEITVFKSVGHALEDLIASDYYYKKYNSLQEI